jgi:hypothetical protein
VYSPLSKNLSKTKKKKSDRSLSKQKPHYFELDQRGEVILSPFKIPKKKCAKLKCPTSVPQIPVKRCKLKKEITSPASPEMQKKGQLDRMRMPPPASPTEIRTPNSIISPFRSPSPSERFGLNSPLLRRPPTTPSYSPIVPSIFSESPIFGDEWKISDYYFNSEDSSENDEKEIERNYKYWCRKDNLDKILEKQVDIDPDVIFGSPNFVCDLEQIFNRNRITYKRTDRLSGCWSPCSVHGVDTFST